MKKLVGETEDYVIVLEFRTDRDRFSVSGVEYGGTESLFTEEEGETRAEEYLEDGELWRMAVEAERTEQSLSDWIGLVLNTDGWQHVIGDVEEVRTKDGDWLYTYWGSCGQIDMHLSPEDFINPFIPMSEIETIFKFWKLYHLKDLSEVPKEDLEEMRLIFTPESTLNDWRPEVQS